MTSKHILVHRCVITIRIAYWIRVACTQFLQNSFKRSAEKDNESFTIKKYSVHKYTTPEPKISYQFNLLPSLYKTNWQKSLQHLFVKYCRIFHHLIWRNNNNVNKAVDLSIQHRKTNIVNAFHWDILYRYFNSRLLDFRI